MSKKANHWEIPISTIIPYLKWNDLSDGKFNVWETGRHNHASYELHIILSGECSLSINNAELILHTGEGILIAPEVFHAPNSVTQPFCRLSLSFSLDESQISELIPDKNAFLLFSVDEPLKNLCSDIFADINEKESLFYKELLATQFGLLVLRVLRAVKKADDDSVTKKFHPNQLEDMSIIDVFFVNTPPKLRTKENLAKLLHCSERQVLRKIYTLYGMSFQKKLMLSRIDTAQHLLRVSDKSVEEICTLVGYSDKAAFYKTFRLHTNTTPIKFRKENK